MVKNYNLDFFRKYDVPEELFYTLTHMSSNSLDAIPDRFWESFEFLNIDKKEIEYLQELFEDVRMQDRRRLATIAKIFSEKKPLEMICKYKDSFATENCYHAFASFIDKNDFAKTDYFNSFCKLFLDEKLEIQYRYLFPAEDLKANVDPLAFYDSENPGQYCFLRDLYYVLYCDKRNFEDFFIDESDIPNVQKLYDLATSHQLSDKNLPLKEMLFFIKHDFDVCKLTKECDVVQLTNLYNYTHVLEERRYPVKDMIEGLPLHKDYYRKDSAHSELLYRIALDLKEKDLPFETVLELADEDYATKYLELARTIPLPALEKLCDENLERQYRIDKAIKTVDVVDFVYKNYPETLDNLIRSTYLFDAPEDLLYYLTTEPFNELGEHYIDFLFSKDVNFDDTYLDDYCLDESIVSELFGCYDYFYKNGSEQVKSYLDGLRISWDDSDAITPAMEILLDGGALPKDEILVNLSCDALMHIKFARKLGMKFPDEMLREEDKPVVEESKNPDKACEVTEDVPLPVIKNEILQEDDIEL